MSAKKRNEGGLVYSTHPDSQPDDSNSSGENDTLPPAQQLLRLWLDRKRKGGKTATVIRDFIGTDEDLQVLAKKMKQSCSVGGNAKDGEIVLQGDCRDRVATLLDQWGYRWKKAGG